MELPLIIAWLYFGGTLFFYFSAQLGVYLLCLLCALLYCGGSVALFFVVSLFALKRIAGSPVFRNLRGCRSCRDFPFYRKTDRWEIQSDDTKICVVMVGLPARGKSLIAGKGMYPGMR